MNYVYTNDGAIIPAGDCVVTLRGKEHLVHHFLVTEKDRTHIFFEDGYVLDCDDWVLTIGEPVNHFDLYVRLKGIRTLFRPSKFNSSPLSL